MFDSDKYYQAWTEATPNLYPDRVIIGGLTKTELASVIELLHDRLHDWPLSESDGVRKQVESAAEKMSRALND